MLFATFFTEEEIEFDLVPNRITSQEGLDRVLEFMRLVARATGKNAICTHENRADAVILEYQAQSGQFVYSPHHGGSEAL